MMPVAVQVARQVDEGDCAIAVLTMLSGRPYPSVRALVAKHHPKAHQRGLWTRDIVRIAERLGLTLVSRHVLPDDATGVLIVGRVSGRGTHAVALFQGVVIDPYDGVIWDRDTFLTKRMGWFLFLEVT